MTKNIYTSDFLLSLAENALSTCENDYGGYQSFNSDLVKEALTLIREQLSRHKCPSCESKQAEIDRLMLEFCPDEMTVEQLENWKKAQRFLENEEDI